MKWEKYDIRNVKKDEYLKGDSLRDKEKKARVDRFRFIDDKKRTVAGEMLARKMISKECGLTPESIVFSKTEHGKPIVLNSDIHFNVSHSENIVVCVIADSPVGIDVEKIREYKPSTAKKFCSDEEIRLIEQSENPSEQFIGIWTVKEAYAKFLGTGLTESIFKKSDFYGNILQYKFEDYCISIFRMKSSD